MTAREKWRRRSARSTYLSRIAPGSRTVGKEILKRSRTAWTLWPGSIRVSICAAALWVLGILSPGPWALVVTIPLAAVAVLCLKRHHHLGVLILMFACLASAQIVIGQLGRGSDGVETTSGIIIGQSEPGPSGWSRLTLLTGRGFVEVLSSVAPDEGSWITASTQRLGDIRVALGEPRVTSDPNGGWQWRASMREELRKDSLASGNRGGMLMPGLVVGDTEPQDDRLKEDMRTVSLTHLSAVSGSNVTIITVGVGLLAGVCRAGPKTRTVLGIVACAFYLFIVGFEPSAIRAAGMAVAVAVVFLRGGGTSRLAVVSATVCVLLTMVPILATSVGFVLSVVSTLAIVFAVPPLLRFLMMRMSILPSVLISALLVPLIAQIACTPVLVAIDPRVGLWSVLANALAAPAVLPATVAGFVSLLCSGLGVLGVPLLLWCAELSAWLGSLCAWWIVTVAQLCAGLPGAMLDWPEPPWGTLIALGLMLILAAGVLLLMRRSPWGKVVLVMCVVLSVVTVMLGRSPPPGRDWLFIVCDVGQGSASLIRTGVSSAIVVDTGLEPRAIDNCLDESGVNTVDMMISHFDADHSKGYPGVIWGRELRDLWVSANALGTNQANQMIAQTHAEAAGLSRGSRLMIGEVSVEVLWPPARTREASPSKSDADGSAERNEDSLVLRVERPGLSVLVPGDIGELEQSVIAASLQPVDVLLAPHHGSSDLSEAFYRAASARLGIVSVGENSYGHPARRSLDSFGPVPILRTDECGTVALYADLLFGTAKSCVGGKR